MIIHLLLGKDKLMSKERERGIQWQIQRQTQQRHKQIQIITEVVTDVDKAEIDIDRD